MRNPRDFFKPLAIGAPDPAAEIPLRPSRMIHFLDFSNEKMVAKARRHRDEDRHPARQPRGRDPGRPQGGRARRAHPGRARDGPRLDGAVDARQRARVALGARRHHPARRARSATASTVDHGPQGRGPVGHPLRRSPARPARGQGRARAPDPRPRHPRDVAGRDQPRGHRDRQPAHAGHELRPGRPGRLAAHEDHARRRRAPRLPRRSRIPTPRTRTRPAPAPSRTRGTTRSRAWSTPARPPGSCPSTARTATSRTSLGCETQFRAAFLLGCVGAWSLHPRPDRHRQEGLLPRPRRGRLRQEGHRGDPRRRAACT